MTRDGIPQVALEPPNDSPTGRDLAPAVRSHLREKAAWIRTEDVAGLLGYIVRHETPQPVLDALWYLEDVGLAVVERGRWATTERPVRGEWRERESEPKAALR